MPKIKDLEYRIVIYEDKVDVVSYYSGKIYDKHSIDHIKIVYFNDLDKRNLIYKKYRWLEYHHPEYLL